MDYERAIRPREQARKRASDDTESAYLKDLHSDQPTATVRTIVNDDRLTREAKERMIGVAKSLLLEAEEPRVMSMKIKSKSMRTSSSVNNSKHNANEPWN